jgi:hypothetical protein
MRRGRSAARVKLNRTAVRAAPRREDGRSCRFAAVTRGRRARPPSRNLTGSWARRRRAFATRQAGRHATQRQRKVSDALPRGCRAGLIGLNRPGACACLKRSHLAEQAGKRSPPARRGPFAALPRGCSADLVDLKRHANPFQTIPVISDTRSSRLLISRTGQRRQPFSKPRAN